MRMCELEGASIHDQLHGFSNNQSYQQTTEGLSFALKGSMISPKIMTFFPFIKTSEHIKPLTFSSTLHVEWRKEKQRVFLTNKRI